MGLEILSFDSRDEWLDARKKYVTATEVSQLIRRSQSYWDELREIKDGRRQAPDIGHLPAVRHGRDREEAIVPTVRNVDSRLQHNERLFVLNGRYAATPDLVSDDREIVGEIKAVKDKRLDTCRNSSGWPTPAYYDQMQWQMFVTGAGRCVFAWEPYEDWGGELVPREDYRAHQIVKFDRQRVAELKKVADKFLAHEAPDIPDKVHALLSQLRDVRKEKAHVVQPILDREKRILDELRDVAGGVGQSWDAGDIRVTVTAPSESKRFDKKKLFADHPDISENDYTKTTKTKPRVTVTEGD